MVGGTTFFFNLNHIYTFSRFISFAYHCVLAAKGACFNSLGGAASGLGFGLAVGLALATTLCAPQDPALPRLLLLLLLEPGLLVWTAAGRL